MADSDVKIKITGEIDGFTKAIKEAQKDVKDFNDVLSTAGKTAGIAFAALTAEAFIALRAFGEQEKATNSLSQALRNQGIASDALVQKYTDQASALQTLTGVADEQIIQGQALLQSNLGAIEVTEDLTKAVLDLAAGTGQDLDSAFAAVAKTIGSSTNALARSGVEVDGNASKQEKLSQIIEGVNKKHKGQAEAALLGVGSIKGLAAAVGELQEEFGKRLAPAFERITKLLTEFTTTLKDNKGLIDLIAQVGIFAGILTGLITVLAGAGFVMTGLKVASIALSTTLGPLVLGLAAVSGALLIAANYLGLFTSKITDLKTVKDADTEIANLQTRIEKLKEFIDKTGGSDFFGFGKSKQQLVELNTQLQVLQASRDKLASQEGEQESKRKKIQAEQTAIRTKDQEIELENTRFHKEQLLAEEFEYSDKFQALLKERNETNLALIKAKDEEEIQALVDKQIRINEQIVLQQELDDELRLLVLEKEQQFSDAKIAITLREKQIIKEAAQEELALKQKEYATRLLEEAKYGKAYATLQEVLRSAEIQGAKAFSEGLIQLQTSQNSVLKTIGKAAAVTQITINTAQTASSVFKGAVDALGYPAGPILGAISAAAAVAFGLEQIGKVTSAAKGGIIPNAPGGLKIGTDTVPAVLTPGEIVVPRQNFDEVINAVAASRASEGTRSASTGLSGGGGGGVMEVIIGFRDNAIEIIEQKLLERRAVGVGNL